MSAAAEISADAASGDRLARRNVLVLALAQALAGADNTVIIGAAGIIGAALAGDKSMATIPVSTFVIGMWVGALPVGCRSAWRPLAIGAGVTSARSI